LVPLLVEEAHSASARRRLRQDAAVVAWWATSVEVTSALCRRAREGSLDERALAQAIRRLGRLRSSWTEVLPGLPVRAAAERLLRVHALRATDALQLAAAAAWSGEPRDEAAFVTLDTRQAQAAEREGFRVDPLDD